MAPDQPRTHVVTMGGTSNGRAKKNRLKKVLGPRGFRFFYAVLSF